MLHFITSVVIDMSKNCHLRHVCTKMITVSPRNKHDMLIPNPFFLKTVNNFNSPPFGLYVIFQLFFLLKKNIYIRVQRVVCCSHQSDRLGYVSRTNQIAALGYVFRTNLSVVFVLLFERCSNFNEVMRDQERAVRKIESSFRMENIGFSVFLTCILPRFMRNAILLDR